jgi:hypothetical protein
MNFQRGKNMPEGSEKENLVKEIKEVMALYGIPVDDEEGQSAAPKTPEEYLKLLEKTQDKLDSLNQKAELIASNLGMTREQMNEFANNPKNFTPQQWETLQRIKKESLDFQETTIQKLQQAQEAMLASEPKAEGGPKKEAQKKKGGKKKNWLQL